MTSREGKSPRIKAGDTLNCNKLLYYVKPVYPKEAREKRVNGTVRLRAVINRTGHLHDLRVINGDPLLVPAALSAARQWRYTPCLLNSEPVEVIIPIELHFYLPR